MPTPYQKRPNFLHFLLVSLWLVGFLHSSRALAFSTSSSSNKTVQTNSMGDDGSMRFGKFLIPKASIFGHSPQRKAAAFVNLRPIVPGHVLVVPKRIVPHLEDLPDDEYIEMWTLVRTVQSMLKEAYEGTTAFNVAVQDGRASGQSVPHVHVHILPRQSGDFERNDDVYDALEAWAPTPAMAAQKGSTNIEVPDDADRVDRTLQMMEDEAALYRGLLQKGQADSL